MFDFYFSHFGPKIVLIPNSKTPKLQAFLVDTYETISGNVILRNFSKNTKPA